MDTIKGNGAKAPSEPTEKEARARKVLKMFEGSGLTRREFVLQHGLNIHWLAWWKREVVRRDKARAETSTETGDPKFLPVTLVNHGSTALPAGCVPYEVVLGSGRLLRVPRDFDTHSLRTLVQALEGLSC